MSGIIDVALGLVFIYLLLSLICSALVELWEARVSRFRTRNLLPDGKKRVIGMGSAEALLLLLKVAGDSGTAEKLDKALASIEQWYDNATDRMSGWYKRHTNKFMKFRAAVRPEPTFRQEKKEQ